MFRPYLPLFLILCSIFLPSAIDFWRLLLRIWTTEVWSTVSQHVLYARAISRERNKSEMSSFCRFFFLVQTQKRKYAALAAMFVHLCMRRRQIRAASAARARLRLLSERTLKRPSPIFRKRAPNANDAAADSVFASGFISALLA
jgi:hypothetical protein